MRKNEFVEFESMICFEGKLILLAAQRWVLSNEGSFIANPNFNFLVCKEGLHRLKLSAFIIAEITR